jgi:hypothetical protein
MESRGGSRKRGTSTPHGTGADGEQQPAAPVGGSALAELIQITGILTGLNTGPAASDTGTGSAGTEVTTGALACVSDADVLASITALETIAHMAQAQQAILTAHLTTTRTAAREAKKKSTRGVRVEVARDITLHRGANATRAQKVVDAANQAPDECPRLFEHWIHGDVSEDQVVIFFDETHLLTPDGRRAADEDVADLAPMIGLKELRHRLRTITARLEPELAAERARKALEDRHVSSRCRGDSMMKLNALLPGIAGQGVDTILTGYAKKRRAAGDERTEAQIKADALTGIVIGWARATHNTPKSFAATHQIKTHGATPPDTTDSSDLPDADTQDLSAATTPRLPDLGEPSGTDQLPGLGLPDLEQEPPGFSEVAKAREAFAEFLRNPAGTAGSADTEIGAGNSDGSVGPGESNDAESTVSGHPQAGSGVLPPGVGVQVNLVITDLSAFGITDNPAEIFGLGPIPAPLARELIQEAVAKHAATLKKLYTDPASGALVGMESRSRVFPDQLGQLIAFRDQHCRHPYCDSPIKHLDHIHPHSLGGATSFGNGQGLCARHNLIKDTNATTHPATIEGTGDGTGDIITHLASSGAEFTSPARTFPHENPDTMESTHYWAGYRDGKAQREANTGASDEAMWALHEANLDLSETLAREKAYLRDEYEEMCQTQQDQDRINAELGRRIEHLLAKEADLLNRETDLTTKQTDLDTRRADIERQAETRDSAEAEALKNWNLICPHLDPRFIQELAYHTNRGDYVELDMALIADHDLITTPYPHAA